MRRLWPALLLMSFAPFAQAQQARMQVDGTRLIFDTGIEVEGEYREIQFEDVTALRDILQQHPELEVLELSSGGGEHYPALDMAAMVIDSGLETHVRENCESSCVTLFLAGTKRTLARGGRLGFHQLSWNAESVQGYYEKNREERGWETPFEFAEWVYQDTQTETYNRLTYMISRGVDPQFAIQTLRRPDTRLWFPYRSVLLAAGVLTE